MKCKKCKNNLDDDSKFCMKCGEKVSTETTHDIKTGEKKFESQTINEIREHLEFLGYTNEFDTDNPKKVVSISRLPTKPTITCSSSVDNIVYLNSNWNGLKEVNTVEQYRCLNKLTSTNVFAQLTITDNGNLAIFSTYIGEYSKKRFGEFFDIFIADINRVLNDETFKKLFIK
jgi:hypothetical protein